MKFRAWHVPLRLTTGAFILNSGIAKARGGNEERDKQVHGMAAGAFPAFESVDASTFTRGLGAAEVALGAALLTPVVPPGLAGLGLTAFSGGLLGLYWRTPGLHEPGSVLPTPRGTAMAKDVWMAAIGSALVVDSVLSRLRRTGRSVAHVLPGLS